MANTRTTVSPGQFAADAVTTIPPIPTQGVAYRDTTTTQDESEQGWPYGTRVDSGTFNQIMFQLTGLMKILDTQGLLGWTNLVNYATGAIVMGSDGVAYQALQASGPGSTVADPLTSPAFWSRFGAVAASNAEVAAGVDTTKFVTPATLRSTLPTGNFGSSGNIAIPVMVGSIKRELIIQWGSLTLANNSFVSFSRTFPNACFAVVGADANGSQGFGSAGQNQSGFTLRASASTFSFTYIAVGF